MGSMLFNPSNHRPVLSACSWGLCVAVLAAADTISRRDGQEDLLTTARPISASQLFLPSHHPAPSSLTPPTTRARRAPTKYKTVTAKSTATSIPFSLCLCCWLSSLTVEFRRRQSAAVSHPAIRRGGPSIHGISLQ